MGFGVPQHFIDIYRDNSIDSIFNNVPFWFILSFLFCIVLLFNLFIEYVWFPYSSEGNKKRENKLEGNIHQTKWQYRKYLVGEMFSKIRIENRKPKSKISSESEIQIGTLLKIEMTHVNYILS